VFRWGDGEERHRSWRRSSRGRRFAFVWGEPEPSVADEGSSRVQIELEEIDDGTRVTVTETPTAGWASAIALRAMLQCARVAA
jgi:activator of Hsp90 ATPase-like protein